MKLEELAKLMEGTPWAQDAETQNRSMALFQARGNSWENLYQELEMSSRYVDTHRDTTFTNGVVNLHSHGFFELLYCDSDAGVEYLLGSERYRLRRGDVVFVPPGVSHRPILPEVLPEPYRRVVLWVSREMMGLVWTLSEEEGSCEKPFLLRTAGTPWESLGEHFRAGVREAETKSPGHEQYLVGSTMVLLVELQRMLRDRGAGLQGGAEQKELPDLAMEYIEEHLADRMTLGEVAGHLWVSESTLSQAFRKKMGVSFCHYVTVRRLIAAKGLMDRGLPPGEVNERVGFRDYSTFYRAFKREYGIAPGEYRAFSARPEARTDRPRGAAGKEPQ